MSRLPPRDYAALLTEVKARVRAAQYAALKSVNQELVGLYWDIGRMIVTRQTDAAHGAAIAEQLAADLRLEFPGVNGYSRRNIFYMREFFLAYRDCPKVQPLVAQIGWTHNLLIFLRCDDPIEREFYLRMTAKFGWTKAVLVHQIESQSHEKTLLGQTNFDRALTPALRAQAKLAVKDEYTFDFLELGGRHSERELQRALLARIKDFLRATGGRFAFVGSQFRLEVDAHEYFIDLLLFHRHLKCLVAVDLKIGAFEPEFAGKMQFYLAALDAPGPAQGRERFHRHHSLQGKKPHHCGVCAARRPQTHRRGHLPHPETTPQGIEGATARARGNHETAGGRAVKPAADGVVGGVGAPGLPGVIRPPPLMWQQNASALFAGES